MTVPEGVTVVDHVLLRRLVSILRDRGTHHGLFRQTLDEAAMILAYEAMRFLRSEEHEVQTPLEPATGVRLADEVVLVAILRAGLGMVDGFLRLVPDARVGHLGMYRDEEALRPVGYYENIPSGVADAEVFVVDPMLATGGSATQATASSAPTADIDVMSDRRRTALPWLYELRHTAAATDEEGLAVTYLQC